MQCPKRYEIFMKKREIRSDLSSIAWDFLAVELNPSFLTLFHENVQTDHLGQCGEQFRKN
jgi:hypothetical protein